MTQRADTVAGLQLMTAGLTVIVGKVVERIGHLPASCNCNLCQAFKRLREADEHMMHAVLSVDGRGESTTNGR